MKRHLILRRRGRILALIIRNVPLVVLIFALVIANVFHDLALLRIALLRWSDRAPSSTTARSTPPSSLRRNSRCPLRAGASWPCSRTSRLQILPAACASKQSFLLFCTCA